MNGPYIFLAYACLFFMATIDNARGPIFPDLLQTFNINSSQGSWVFTLCSFTGLTLALTVNKWLHRLGTANASKWAILSGSLSAIIMAFSGSRPDAYPFFLVGIFLLGLCMGTTSITINLLVVKNCHIDRQRQVLSGMHSMYGLASLLSPGVLAYLFARNVGWQGLFYGIGLCGLLLFAYSLRIPNQRAKLGEAPETVPLRLLITIGGMIALYVCGEVLAGTRMVQYMVELGISKADASAQLSLFFLLILVGRFIATFVGSRIPTIILMTASLTLSLLLVALGLSLWPACLAWSGLTMSVFYPAAINWITIICPRYADDLIAKLMITVGASLSALHFGFGLLSTAMGIIPAMKIVIVFILLSLLLLIYIHFSPRIAKMGTAR